ncbi:MAG: SH3 domain-containing protein [Rhizobiales bacterium]|nr:SH3 domain-containing protein [Hyphomicrobiales bacterium]
MLVPQDASAAAGRQASPVPPRASEESARPAVEASPKSDDVAARLEAALRGHLETVASAFAAPRAPVAKATATEVGAVPEEEAKIGSALAARSIYAPEGPRLPAATPLDLEPLPPLPAGVRPDLRDAVREEAGVDAPADAEWVEALADEAFDREAADADEDAFGHEPPGWLTAGEAGRDDEDVEEEEADEPLPRAFTRRAWRQPEGLAYLPPLVETTRGISAKVLAAATLFGLAVGVGAIAAYQYSVAPVATPAVALVPNHPAADSSKIAKLDADRVPGADETVPVKVASATATPAAGPVPNAAPARASADAIPAPAPLAAAKPAVVATAEVAPDDGGSPALRSTEDAALADAAPAPSGDTENFVATVASRPAQARPQPPAASGGQVLAYAPTPRPDDPVARSFFGKGDDNAGTPAKKSTASIPAPSPGKAKVLMAVNMRAKPDNDAPSVKILGAGAKVQVVQCDGWCEVVADGKRGYIFKKFLDN